jgi:hypothetical protein
MPYRHRRFFGAQRALLRFDSRSPPRAALEGQRITVADLPRNKFPEPISIPQAGPRLNATRHLATPLVQGISQSKSGCAPMRLN